MKHFLDPSSRRCTDLVTDKNTKWFWYYYLLVIKDVFIFRSFMEKNLCPATYSNLSVYVWRWLTASTANWIITPCNALTEELKNVLESQRQERRQMNSHSISPIFDWRIVLSDRSIFAWQSVCAIAISRLVRASHPLDCPSSLQYRIRLKTFLAWPAKWFR